MLSTEPQRSSVDRLRGRIGAEWPAIREAHDQTRRLRDDLELLFQGQMAPDTSLVFFGSVARGEVTSGSDLDWILLVDGQSIPEHEEQAREIQRTLETKGYIEPGKSGVFGGMVGSHSLIHKIGGEDDSNSNTTRRALLLLESVPIGGREAYDRVRRQIIKRYLDDDYGVRYGSGEIQIPRFLLNDLTRYWRTITVDFVYKQRLGSDHKWALRNVKLRMSRKLMFAAGLLQCFLCHLDPAAEEARKAVRGPAHDVSGLIEYIEQQLAHTPLEIFARTFLSRQTPVETVRAILDNYDRFLSILDDKTKRSTLENAPTSSELRSSPAWREIQQISGPFHDGLVSLFLDVDPEIKELTMNYGVF